LKGNYIDQKTYERVGNVRVAFIGLGVMGASMAGHLAKAGCSIKVFNRNIEKSIYWTNSFKSYDATYVENLSDVSKDADFVISCVGKDPDVEEITTGTNGCFKFMKKNSIFIDHTTTSSETAIKLFNAANNFEINFIDAPVSGGNIGARAGQLSIMCGGKQEIFEKSKKILSLYSKTVALIGKSGSGQLAKMVNQICIAGLIQGLAEGINFGKMAGLDMSKVVDVIKNGAAGSWQMSNRSKTMINGKYDFGFAVDLMRKDLAILLKKGDLINAELPVTSVVDKFYEDLQKIGHGKSDTTSLLTRLEKKNKQ
tara:strand:- start:41 stop:973 length:933 start_codon:yes stop_codon:yes gene_type:complete